MRSDVYCSLKISLSVLNGHCVLQASIWKTAQDKSDDHFLSLSTARVQRGKRAH